MESDRPIRRSDDLVVQEHAEELLVYDLQSHRAHALNRALADIWRLCDGSRTTSEIARSLAERTEAIVPCQIVELGLEQLRGAGLLNYTVRIAEAGKVSRRELVKRAGLAGFSALPVITSIVVPAAAAAQSGACGVSVGLPCTCNGKVRNFGIPCDSSQCTGSCACNPPFTGCNGGGHFCQGICA